MGCSSPFEESELATYLNPEEIEERGGSEAYMLLKLYPHITLSPLISFTPPVRPQAERQSQPQPLRAHSLDEAPQARFDMGQLNKSR